MNNLSELKDILGDFLNWNNARLTCFTKMLIALFAVRSVNLRVYIRIKEDSIVRVGNKKLCKAEKIFHEVTPKKTLLFPMKVEIFRQSVYLAGSRSALE